ncbi:MAG: glycyl-radical enzyme activating protein [Tyzzerella sp.]|nr:glycyl-radical enzyme activating protein [Tyzzerella sp.]
MNGIIFDIKEFTVHDGPGSRITVFLKGCPLKCKWCHNPEGLKVAKQLMYKSNFCTHCGACRKPCEHEECQPFGRCIHVCPNGALSIVGEEVSAKALAVRLQKHADILRLMGGGITISGGEPMLQPDFVCELAENLENIHKAIQTSGYADLETYKKVVGRMDYVLQDIKLADEKEHIKYTGVSNEKILRNIEWLKTSGKPFVFRVPLIPGITDTEANLTAISEMVGDCRTELMPYNPLAGAKYAMVDMEYTLSDKENREEDFTKYFQNAVMMG